MARTLPHTPFRTLALAGMEACWVGGWLLLVHEHACDQCLFIPGVFAFGPAAFLADRLLPVRAGRGPLRRALLWVFWVVAAVLYTGWVTNGHSPLEGLGWLRTLPGRVFSIASFPSPEFLSVCGTALLWGLGVRLSGPFRDDSILLTEFQFGLSMLLVLLFLETQWALHIREFPPLTILFFLFALTGLSVSLLQGSPDWSSPGRRALWTGVVGGAIVLVLSAGGLAVFLLSPELMSRVISVIEELFRGIGRGVAWLLSLLASLLPTPGPQRFDLPPPPPGIDRDPSVIAGFLRIPEGVRKVGGFLVGAIWILLFLGAIWTLSTALFKWLLQRVARSEDAEVEPIPGAFREDLLWLLRLLTAKIKRLSAPVLRVFGRTSERAAPPSSARIVYRRLLRWAALRGFPRGAAQTPGEYLGTLVEKVPGAGSEAAFITAQYVVERYGPEALAVHQVEVMEAKWKVVKRAKTNQRSQKEWVEKFRR